MYRRSLFVLLCGLLFSAPSVFGLGFKVRNYFAGVQPQSVVTGDFNGDGKLDFAIADGCYDVNCSTTGAAFLLLGNGDGTFTKGKKFHSGSSGTTSDFLTAGDFNGDGKLDLAIINNGINRYGDVTIMLGNGDGTFQAPVDYAVGGSTPVWVEAGDFNGDGKLDLAVSVTTTNSVAVLLENGDGTFQAAVNYPVESSPQGLTIADVNHDGKPDIVVANECGHDPKCRQGTVSILLGKGNGTFRKQASYFVGMFPLAVAVADFNGDHRQDLAVTLPCSIDPTCTTNGGVGILLGDGKGKFGSPTVYVGTGTDTVRLGVGDFNGDNHMDVVALNYQTGNATVFLNKGDGTFRTAATLTTGQNSISVAVADFNGDKATDLAVVNQTPNTVTVFLNKHHADAPFIPSPPADAAAR